MPDEEETKSNGAVPEEGQGPQLALPDGVELVYQVMVPIQIDLGCKECKTMMELKPASSLLIGSNPNAKPVPVYGCPKCKQTVSVAAMFPSLTYTAGGPASSAPPVVMPPEALQAKEKSKSRRGKRQRRKR